MRVHLLPRNPKIYTCQAYLVLGSWNRLQDINTLVDVGTDASILRPLESISTGVGKRPVEQVILTHGHFDHRGGLGQIIERFHPEVYAFAKQEGVTHLLEDGQKLRLGEVEFEVLHTPGHSNDSVCLYSAETQTLFSGDTPLRILTPGSSYAPDFIRSLERIAQLPVQNIYSGHDPPVTEGAAQLIAMTLSHVKAPP